MSNNTAFNRMVGKRIRLAREEKGLTQEAVSKEVGFKDRQTLSTIEAGQRKLKAEELADLMEILNKPVEFFTDPYFIPDEEGAFCWRATASPSKLNSFELKIRKILAAYRRFGEFLGRPHVQIDQSIRVKRSDTYDKVSSLAENLVETWGLGEVPSLKLRGFLEECLYMLVLRVDAPEDISGAACRLPQFNSLIVNRKEHSYRRNFDGAHEFFHILTWESLPPRHREAPSIGSPGQPKEEKLANAFAAGILMPKKHLAPRWKERGKISVTEWINKTSSFFKVSAPALYYRLLNLGWIKKSDISSLKNLQSCVPEDSKKDKDLLFSRIFVEKLYGVLDRGFVSVRKAASILECTIEDLTELFEAYKIKAPFDL